MLMLFPLYLCVFLFIQICRAERRIILSLDGGGIKGIIEARILAEFEKRTNKPVHELFDMVVGTSTGGLIACGLTSNRQGFNRPFTAEELVEFFRTNSTKIFPWVIPFSQYIRRGPKYSEKVTKNGIEKLLKENFGDAKLSEAKKPLIVTAVDIAESDIFFFKSHRINGKQYHDHYIRDVCRATSAAPTYFPPAFISAINKPDYVEEPPCFALVDGGVAANNPVAVAYQEARKLFGKDAEIKIISIGTGESGENRLQPYPKEPVEIAKKIKADNDKARAAYNKAQRRGLVRWISPMFGLMFDGQSTKDDYLVRNLENISKITANYSRLQVYFGNIDIEMDNASKIPEIEKFVEDYLNEGGSRKIDDLIAECGWKK